MLIYCVEKDKNVVIFLFDVKLIDVSYLLVFRTNQYFIYIKRKINYV